MDAEAHLRAFLADLGRRHARASTDRAYYVLPRFFAFLAEQGTTDVRAVTLGHLQGFAAKLAGATTRRGTSLSLGTRRDYMRTVRGLFAFLERQGDVLTSPARALVMPRSQRLPREVLSVPDARRLMEAPPGSSKMGQRDRAILEVFYGTGLRLREVARLDVTDVDLQEGRLLVRDGKGRKDRMVPIAGRAAAALGLYLREVRPLLADDPADLALFLSFHGRRLSRVSLQGRVRDYARLAGLAPASPHVLRHTCATHLLKGGASVRHVQELLGHKSIETTEVYTRVAIEDLHEVIARCHPRGGQGKRRMPRKRR